MEENIFFQNDLPFVKAFSSLPVEISSSLDRSFFLEQFSSLRRSQITQINDWLRILDLEGCYKVLNEGDMHVNGSTVVLSSDTRKLVLKPKLAESDLFIKKMSDELSLILGVNIKVPKIIPKDNFYVQEFIQDIKTEKQDDYSFGVLIIFCLWFGLIDLHHENIILSKNSINLIDADCLFFSKKRLRFRSRVENIGFFYSDIESIQKSGVQKFNLNLDYPLILKGYKDALKILRSNHFFSNYKEFDKIIFRRVYVSTELYTRFLNKRFLYGWDNLQVAQEWLRIRKKYTLEEPIDNFSNLIESELGDLIKWCIPFYYQKGNSVFNQKMEFIGHSPEPPSTRFTNVHKYLNNKTDILDDLKYLLNKTDSHFKHKNG